MLKGTSLGERRPVEDIKRIQGMLDHADLIITAWLDDKGQFMAEAAANPVYRLLGKKGLGTNTTPPMGTPLLNGDLAFRQHFGPHTAIPNWPYFIQFSMHYFNPVSIRK